ncbi:TIGR04255 family protein [Micromonospora sp. WMMD1219]|uniref:TIGR04255 family protein n=1 Tax=Micromonospora sp. WMMD1219 TaxID=3404115 RepID=UPI003BF5C7BE
MEDAKRPDLPERRIYRNPPIVEAIVELRFLGGLTWNLTIPGRFYDQIKSEFPDEPEQREVVEANFGGKSPDEAMLSVNRKEQRVLFRNGSRLLVLGPNVLTVNSVRPYEGWESLKARIDSALSTYRSILNPDAVSTIGVRYINRIELAAEQFSLGDYFTIVQGLPVAGFPARLNSFFDRMELTYDEIPATIAFTWATTRPEKSDRGSAFVLDLDLRWNEPCSFENVLANVEELRNRERIAFESLINDRLREIFDANENS